MGTEPIEAECKFRVEQIDALKLALEQINARYEREERHRDHYFRHPSRNFRETDEALRIREIDGDSFVTYKGPRRSGPIKIRPEIELPLAPETSFQWIQIWENLGFTRSLTVEKTRFVYTVSFGGSDTTVTIDRVLGLGDFAEIERVLQDESEIETAQTDILNIAKLLGLTNIEKKSYLGMLLQKQASE